MTHGIPRFRVGSQRAVLLSLPVLAIVVSACGASSSPATGSSAAGSSAAGPMTISATQTSLGSVLSGPSGDTVYTLISAQGTPIPCTGQCLSAWPPVTATAGSSAHAASGVSATLAVNTSVMQVTADGAPLYYFSGDSAAGQVNGQGIKSFGGIWYAVQASGKPLTSTAAAAAPASTPNAANGAGATPTSSGPAYGY
jgi:predicted lipoprotein with Yx(FWY)xxD motif